MSIEETYEKLGIPIGIGEKVFWNIEYKKEDDVPGLYRGQFCTGFPNRDRAIIVAGDNSRADLIVPKNIFIEKHGLVSFFKFNPEDKEQKELMGDMIETALKNANPEDLIMFFNALREKVTPDNRENSTVMTVSYLHLWAVEKSRMKRNDEMFHENSKSKNLFNEEEIESIKKLVLTMKNCSLLDGSNPLCFSPVHIQLKTRGKNDKEEIVKSILEASYVIQKLEKTEIGKKFLDKGFRLMIRKDKNWSANILGGGSLSPISKSD